MNSISPSVSLTVTLTSLLNTILAVVHSLRTRGRDRTILFAALSVGLAGVGEYLATNRTVILQHHLQPQVKRVPLAALLSWYNISYITFALLDGLLASSSLSPEVRRQTLPATTAVTATSLDLLLDPMGLDMGLWEWTQGGPYANEITGPNGKRGIPLDNFVGWMLLTGITTATYQWLTDRRIEDMGRSDAVERAWGGRIAALLLAPYYLGGVAWTVQQNRLRYLLYSFLVPLVLARALLPHRPPSTVCGGVARAGG
ncbi:MAG: carotenoid biosynthesis protein [Chloroflexota bacterium]|nr:carotenoid biosynthesis protein [Chloroflexota bacterium]